MSIEEPKKQKYKEDNIIEFEINYELAINLLFSLNKLKQGKNGKSFYKSVCQINLFINDNLMVIYIKLNHQYLRIKLEVNNIIISKKHKKKLKDLLIFTIDIKSFHSFLQFLLKEKGIESLLIGIKDDFSEIYGKILINEDENILDSFIIVETTAVLISNNSFDAVTVNSGKSNDKETLETLFQNDDNCSIYLFENNDLKYFYKFILGINKLYLNDSNDDPLIGISVYKNNLFVYDFDFKNIKENCNISNELKNNIKAQNMFKINLIKNNKINFNAFYQIKSISTFLASFYNKDDNRLWIKIDPNGKTILAFKFSYYSNIDEDENENNNEVEEENNNNENDQELDKSDTIKTSNQGKKSKIYKIDKSNIVEMIFTPIIFHLSKE